MAPRVSAVTPMLGKVNGRHTGAAPLIRKTKVDYPELSNGQIAKRVGCDVANVHRVLSRFLGAKYTQEDLEKFQSSKADIYDALQQRMLGSIDDEVIAKSQLLPRVTSAAILEDKARTIRGQATSVNVVMLLDAVQAIKQMRRPSTTPQDVVIEGGNAVEDGALVKDGGSLMLQGGVNAE